jgi:Na+-driven multidrug efflux pump
VGIYSFAAMLVDGMYQVLAVVRLNFNPLLVSSLTSRDFAQARRLLTRSKRWVLPAAGAFAALLAAAFWFLATVLMPAKGLGEGMPPLAALLIGLTLVSPFIPFDNALLVSGHPGYQTLQHLSVVTSNILFNAALVPVLGIFGSGLATALSYCVGAVVLIAMVRRFLRWNLLSNTVLP